MVVKDNPDYDLIPVFAMLLLASTTASTHADVRPPVHAPPRDSTGAFCECIADVNDRLDLPAAERERIRNLLSRQDPRTHISRTGSNRILNAIGQLVSNQDDGYCTATLVAPALVLTNLHCAGDEGAGVRFRIGRTGDPARPFKHEVKGTVVAAGDTVAADEAPAWIETARDWAVVRLQEPVGQNPDIGFLQIASVPDNGKLTNSEYTIAGFPAYKDPTYLWGQEQVASLGDEEDFEAASSSGYSGAPVMTKLPGPDGETRLAVIGIVQGGYNGDRAIGDWGYDFRSTIVVNFMDPQVRETLFPAVGRVSQAGRNSPLLSP